MKKFFFLAFVSLALVSCTVRWPAMELPEVITPTEPYVQPEIDIDNNFFYFTPPVHRLYLLNERRKQSRTMESLRELSERILYRWL